MRTSRQRERAHGSGEGQDWLISLPGDDRWYILSNLMFSVTHQFQSDEIDLVAVGPPGVRVVEVKHWGDAHTKWAGREADKLTQKARRIGGTLPLRRLAGYVNLELQTEPDEAFHRIYKGVHSSRKDRVFLHLYDLSVPGVGSAERTARREHDALHHQLFRFRWAPRILDSFQDAPGYADEMKFFTVVDPAVPSIDDTRLQPRPQQWSVASADHQPSTE